MSSTADKTILHPDPDKVQLIVHRNDEGIPYVAPLAPRINGDIHSAKNYVTNAQSKQNVKPENAVVYLNHKSGTVTLYADTTNTFATIVTGQLKRNQELLDLNINNEKVPGKEYTLTELRSHFKFARQLFASPEVHETLMKNLQQTSVRILKLENEGNDNKGNQNSSQDITTELPQYLKEPFYVNAPIFDGQPPVKFQVELVFSAEGRKLTCWLESVEFKELIKVETMRIMDEQRQHFTDLVVIDVY